MVTHIEKDEWISLATAMQYLCVGKGTLQRLIRSRKLTVRRIEGEHPRMKKAEILALVKGSTGEAVQSPVRSSGNAGDGDVSPTTTEAG